MEPTALAYVMQQHTTVTFDTVPETAKPPRLFLQSIFVADRPSGEQLADHPRRLDAGELLIQALEEVGKLLMAEAEEVEDRGVEIADRHFVFRGVEAEVIVVESEDDDPEEVSDNFVARLTELAPSNDHVLGLTVQVLPIPELRGSFD